MTTLRLVTAGPPAPKAPQPRKPRHLYICTCDDCNADRAVRRPAICSCDKAAVYADPTADGDLTCLHCGRPPAHTQPLKQAA